MERTKLNLLENLMCVEKTAFMPSIRTTRRKINNRLEKEHEYITDFQDTIITGSLAMRFEKFNPEMYDFSQKFPTFDDYAELPNNEEANAGFIYSLGVNPRFRDSICAKRLIQKAMKSAKNRGMKYIVGDARIPSYNGGENLPYEKFDFNLELHNAIDNYHETGELPPRKLLEKDPVTGFYLKAFSEMKILGITNKDFWKGDEPCGGQMCIIYKELEK